MKYLEKDEYNNTKRNLKEMIKFINDAKKWNTVFENYLTD